MSPSEDGGERPEEGAEVPAPKRRARKSDPSSEGLFPAEEVRVTYLPAEHVAERVDVPPGFQLRRLRLLGAQLGPAELEFGPGLNAVVGPSNTGKSFAFKLIDYALGAETLVKIPPVAQAYDEVVLEVVSAANEWFTVRRNLPTPAVASPPARWYDVTFERVGDPTVRPRSVSGRHRHGKTNTLSAQYLALSLLSGLRIQANQENETQDLSFRNVLDLCMVDETRIIGEGSAVLGPNPTTNTAEKSLFDLMLSGRDASDLVAIQNTADRRGRLQAQADLLDTLIDRERGRIRAAGSAARVAPIVTADATPAQGRPDPDAAELERRRHALDQTIARLEQDLASVATSVDDARREAEALNTTVLEDRSRLLVVRELLTRFDLLGASYRTDLDRLAFIEAGSDLLAQLPAVSCPTCGQPVEPGHSHERADTGEAPVAPLFTDDVRAACKAEARSIRRLLRDLESAVDELRSEAGELRSRIRDRTLGIQQLDLRLRQELQPRMAATAAEMRQTTIVRQAVAREESALQHLGTLVTQRYDIERELLALKRRGARLIPPPREVPATEPLTEQVRALLHAWGGTSGSVRFDREAMDFVIAGQTRAAQGKGVRAIWLSAFIVGLMRFCRAEHRPHPGFVILDSPLTTFRGGPRRARGPEDVPEDIEQAFFRHLASSSTLPGVTEQIIVFDNKEPPEDVARVARTVYFTGYGGGGREGFVPVPEGVNPAEIPSAPRAVAAPTNSEAADDGATDEGGIEDGSDAT